MRRVLEPVERVAEVLFGLIMVLTFTGSLSVAEAGRDDVRAMLVGALGCNLAWGIIDGILYLMGTLADRGRGLIALRAVRAASGSEARRLFAAGLPAPLAAVMTPEEMDDFGARLRRLPEPEGKAKVTRGNLLGALGVFLLVFLSTFPVAIPFLFVPHTHAAMRISNAIAIVMLFIAGFAYGRIVGRNPWLFGLAMVALGAVLVAITIALGG